ncbi:MAG: acyl-CoA dehydrogenase [Rhizorhabdus sp.]|uniref:acyl-CoA dehydrogenase n=1 Tax=Rhizorhabdus sp. TaxID=1968843 RepID=UPI001B406226|nr:acyl-CoA dehydrogenase [Rhizorhabdus sp.]MBP8235203.1 acyl-CoA dehydrogenase [Rhizorhabdus sp.]
MSLILSRRDIDFLLFDWLDVEQLLVAERYAAHDRATIDAVIDLAASLAEEQFAPFNKLSDQHEPKMLEDGRVKMPAETATALRHFCEAGLMAMSQPHDVGGMQLPFVVEKAAFAWFQAANAGTSGYALLTTAAANLLLEHGSPEQIDAYVRPMLAGRFFGTMCLSEPQAGSSLADVRTRAVRQGDGSFRLFGNKMWISGGEHDLAESIVHLVLARVEGAVPGVKGLSLFVVPRDLPGGDRNDVSLAGLNHKMGQRGTVNTLLNFGEGRHQPQGAAGAIGWLVGAEGQGLACMFTMMNEARVAVGTSAATLGYTGYLHALDYARGRPQGRVPGNKDPNSGQVPLTRHADVRRMLLAQKAYAEGALALNLYCARLVDVQRTSDGDVREEAALLLDMLTPIAKSWPSQWCLAANDLAIQVHGGYGYTRDYNVEQFYRDNRLNPIHEGTHGIQGIDLLGRKVAMQEGRALKIFGEKVGATCQLAREAGLGEDAQALDDAFVELEYTSFLLQAEPDAETRLANASIFLEAFGHVTLAWIWLEQVGAAAAKQGAFFDGKRAAARYFFAYELPKVEPMLALLISGDRTTLDLDPDIL